jgi:SAM-dependent methyltransferase
VLEHPKLYDLVQQLAGAHWVDQRLTRAIPDSAPAGVMLDLGGGTGSGQALAPGARHYVCVDPALDRLVVAKRRGGLGICADGTRAGLRARSVDLVLCKMVAHHIENVDLPRLVDEAWRVLKPDGHLLFLDPLLAPRRWVSRALWRVDRGSNPRSAAELEAVIDRRFNVVHREEFSVLHRYLLCLARPRP